MRQIRHYNKEFKVEAVKLALNQGRKVSEVAENLGIPPSTLVTWKSRYLKNAQGSFPDTKKLVPAEEKIQELKWRLERVTTERDILKKAVAFFSKDAL